MIENGSVVALECGISIQSLAEVLHGISDRIIIAGEQRIPTTIEKQISESANRAYYREMHRQMNVTK